jgi:hypothetical protein
MQTVYGHVGDRRFGDNHFGDNHFGEKSSHFGGNAASFWRQIRLSSWLTV